MQEVQRNSETNRDGKTSVPGLQAFPTHTPDDQFGAEAESVYADYCAFRIEGVRTGEGWMSRDARRNLVEKYDRLTRQSITERANFDRIHQDAIARAFAQRQSETDEVLKGRS